MNFQTPNLLYPKFLVAFIPKKNVWTVIIFKCLEHFLPYLYFSWWHPASRSISPPLYPTVSSQQLLQNSTTQDKRVSSPKDKSHWHRIAKLLACSPLFAIQYLLRQIPGNTTFMSLYLNWVIDWHMQTLDSYFVLLFKDAIIFGINSAEVENTSVRDP